MSIYLERGLLDFAIFHYSFEFQTTFLGQIFMYLGAIDKCPV